MDEERVDTSQHRACEGEERVDNLGAGKSDVADVSRRRLLRLTAYTAPLVLTLGLPESARAFDRASDCFRCIRCPWNDKS